MIKLYTKNNCPNCVSVKKALKENGIEFEEINAVPAEGFAALSKEAELRELDLSTFSTAPALVVDECPVVWTGTDCIIAIEDREWED